MELRTRSVYNFTIHESKSRSPRYNLQKDHARSKIVKDKNVIMLGVGGGRDKIKKIL